MGSHSRSEKKSFCNKEFIQKGGPRCKKLAGHISKTLSNYLKLRTNLCRTPYFPRDGDEIIEIFMIDICVIIRHISWFFHFPHDCREHYGFYNGWHNAPFPRTKIRHLALVKASKGYLHTLKQRTSSKFRRGGPVEFKAPPGVPPGGPLSKSA